MELRFCLTLKSNYHVSAGFGLGAQLDSVLLRDADGVLVLRGSTLTGILRDGLWCLLQTTPKLQSHFAPHARAEQEQRAAEQSVASAYCREEPVCPLCRIFGSPQRPKRWRIASARPEGAGKASKRESPRARGCSSSCPHPCQSAHTPSSRAQPIQAGRRRQLADLSLFRNL
jgi:hypothetical protein